jgi:hypothetical protein
MNWISPTTLPVKSLEMFLNENLESIPTAGQLEISLDDVKIFFTSLEHTCLIAVYSLSEEKLVDILKAVSLDPEIIPDSTLFPRKLEDGTFVKGFHSTASIELLSQNISSLALAIVSNQNVEVGLRSHIAKFRLIDNGATNG